MAERKNIVEFVLRLKDEMSQRAGRARRSLRQLEQRFRGLTSAVAGFVGFGSIARLLTSATQAAAEQELAIRSLRATLKSANQESEEYLATLQKQASVLQTLTAVGDEQILNLQRQLIAFGATRQNIEQVTTAALDLSAGLGTDLQSAALLLGKALSGDFGTLSRYGILVDKNATKAEKLAEALRQINERFGGQAQAKAESYQGQIKKLSDSYGDLLEVIGDNITKSKQFIGFIRTIRQGIEGLTILLSSKLPSAQDQARQLGAEIFDVSQKLQNLGAGTRRDFISLPFEKLREKAKQSNNEVKQLIARMITLRKMRDGLNTTIEKENKLLDENTKKRKQAAEAAANAAKKGCEKVKEELDCEARKRKEAFEKELADLKATREEEDAIEQEALDARNRKVLEEARVWKKAQEERIAGEKKAAAIIKRVREEHKREIEEQHRAVQALGRDYVHSFGQAIARGEDLSGVIRGITDDLARMALQNTISGIVSGSSGGAAGFGVSSLLGFQHGGDVPGPTGKAHLAVVHGGERVLTKHENQSMSGGDTIINVFNNNGSEVETTSRNRDDGGKQIDIMVKEAVTRDINGGGKLDKLLQTTYGISRRGALR